MISKRAPRRTTPQENLRQFALNSTKGINGNAAPTNVDTVLHAENLITNLDGSVSLRKPLQFLRMFNDARKVIPLYDNSHYLVQTTTGSLRIVDSDNVTKTFTLESREYYSDSLVEKNGLEELPSEMFIDPQPLHDVQASTATIVNVVLNIEHYYVRHMFPSELYDSSTVARLLKVYKVSDTWRISIVVPDLNTLTTADDGSLAFDMNLALDNPYSARDTYHTILPSVKGIVAYTFSDVSPEGLKAIPTVPKTEWSEESYAVPKHYASPERTWASFNVADVSEDSNWTIVSSDSTQTVYSRTFMTVIGIVTVETTVKVTRYATSNTGVEFETVFTYSSPDLELHYAVFDARGVIKLDNLPGETYSDRVSKYLNDSTYLTSLKGQDSDFIGGDTTSYVKISGSFELLRYLSGHTVAELTENVCKRSHRILASVGTPAPTHVVLKAFCNFPNSDVDNVYAAWFKSADGVSWTACMFPGGSYRLIEPTASEDEGEDTDIEFGSENYFSKFVGTAADNYLISPYSNIQPTPRVDTYQIPDNESLEDYAYMFRVVRVDSGKQISVELGRAIYYPTVANRTSIAYWTSGNPASGQLAYRSKQILSYGGSSFDNIIYASAPGSFVFPLTDIADADVGTEVQVTSVVPWKSHMFVTTASSLSLVTPQATGWTSKVISTSVGVPKEDTRCCLGGLNGVLFKSGDKIYMAYPNAYAGDDTQVYITDMSKSVDHILSEYSGDGSQFAFSTNSEYVLMLPSEEVTYCLRYSHDSKTWAFGTYPVRLLSYRIRSLTDISLFAETFSGVSEFQFDAEFKQDAWGDELPNADGTKSVVPIPFELDTGMKTDDISLKRQFVESKFVFATEDDAEMFPMEAYVAIDGDPHVTHLDVNSDSPFWKTSVIDKGVFGTSFRLSNVDETGRSSSGILRQLIIRYSGKGHSIRHILKGKSYSNFRLYETYVRYKTLNVKK